MMQHNGRDVNDITIIHNTELVTTLLLFVIIIVVITWIFVDIVFKISIYAAASLTIELFELGLFDSVQG